MKLHKNKKAILGLIFLLFVFNITWIRSGFSKLNSTKQGSIENSDSNRLTVMTYNLENLFDTEDDPNKDDEAYLPLKYKNQSRSVQKKCQSLHPKWKSECHNLDWSDKNLKSKMHRLSDVILKSRNGIGPDIVIFQEVENLNVLEKLRTEYLIKYYPHKTILIEGPDRRGIDVGIISKLPLEDDPKLHLLKFHETNYLKRNQFPITRGILETQFKLPDQSKLTVFGVHFPSQGTVTEARRQALDQLVRLMKDTPKENLVIAGGDFNITDFEDKKYKYFKKLKSDFMISHLEGCNTCQGTNYFHPRKSWSFLDVLMFSKNHSSWSLDTKSIRVYNQNLYQNNKWGSPKKFELGKHQEGVSDHWPLLADIFLNSSRSNGIRK